MSHLPMSVARRAMPKATKPNLPLPRCFGVPAGATILRTPRLVLYRSAMLCP